MSRGHAGAYAGPGGLGSCHVAGLQVGTSEAGPRSIPGRGPSLPRFSSTWASGGSDEGVGWDVLGPGRLGTIRATSIFISFCRLNSSLPRTMTRRAVIFSPSCLYNYLFLFFFSTYGTKSHRQQCRLSCETLGGSNTTDVESSRGQHPIAQILIDPGRGQVDEHAGVHGPNTLAISHVIIESLKPSSERVLIYHRPKS